MKAIELLIKTLFNRNEMLISLGNEMFVFKTQYGLPPDFFMLALRKQVNYSRDNELVIVTEFLRLQTQHIRKSSPSEKRLNKLQNENCKAIERFWNKGEIER